MRIQHSFHNMNTTRSSAPSSLETHTVYERRPAVAILLCYDVASVEIVPSPCSDVYCLSNSVHSHKHCTSHYSLYFIGKVSLRFKGKRFIRLRKIELQEEETAAQLLALYRARVIAEMEEKKTGENIKKT